MSSVTFKLCSALNSEAYAAFCAGQHRASAHQYLYRARASARQDSAEAYAKYAREEWHLYLKWARLALNAAVDRAKREEVSCK